MLTPFPGLLNFSIFAPTLLRVAIALILIRVIWFVVREHHRLETMSFPVIGRVHKWMIAVSATVTTLAAIGLLVGYETQWAALITLLISIKYAVMAKRYHAILPLSRSAYILIAVIAFSLLLTGAGQFAFDLPL